MLKELTSVGKQIKNKLGLTTVILFYHLLSPFYVLAKTVLPLPLRSIRAADTIVERDVKTDPWIGSY